jgi:hypothetical protein
MDFSAPASRRYQPQHLIDAALGVLDHHATIVAHPANSASKALCHSFQPSGSDQREPDQPNVLGMVT